MTPRERMLLALSFGKPDRIPLTPGYGRESTLAAWHRQGLPESVQDYVEYAYHQAGGTLPWESIDAWFPVNERMIPQFEEKVLELKESSQVVQDWKGNICEIGRQFTVEHLRNAVDFVTRRWIKCPVESRSDWADMKQRYDAGAPGRLPADAAAKGEALLRRKEFLEIRFSGPFWQVREWVGFERLCEMFYDDPAFLGEMIEFWADYVAILLERTLGVVKPDCVGLSEDMAYKGFSMISPKMARQYLLPVWARWGEIIRGAGVPLYAMDSDGFVGELIPIWIDAGINVCDPVEVAAGNDINDFRRRFGKNMAYRGGVDKRAMARGGGVLEAEMDRLRPVIEDGGYVPACDHGVPPDVSWPNYVEYVRMLSRATGWLKPFVQN